MPDMPVWLIDTSVFLEILDVPGKASRHQQIADEFIARYKDGHRFVLPLTTIIETGNHVAQCGGDRRGAARRFTTALRQAQETQPPWIIRDVQWDKARLDYLLTGDSTGSSLMDLLGDGRMGTGDVAILVERDEFRSASNFTDVRIWTLEATLNAYA
ncbi:hypothetical protein [Lapillicoccus jejuensis]|uniref:PIN domain-containing protein n=1 Tax=Lapillicoccus jejuensis TaxID=402171 RepID=A0A542E1N2_9MICO|nr:hypothetical protein [Lapillicoccus jejuensis]TQJ09250.1 hypothetical protein FB458_2360 [Lapillicoccus jejuensis]